MNAGVVDGLLYDDSADFCPHCGEDLDSGNAIDCPSCGEYLDDE